jgi:hypothetical protein
MPECSDRHTATPSLDFPGDFQDFLPDFHCQRTSLDFQDFLDFLGLLLDRVAILANLLEVL